MSVLKGINAMSMLEAFLSVDEHAKVKKNICDVEVSPDARKIILPTSMNKKEGADELMRQWQDEESVMDVDKIFSEWYWKDVLVAIKKVAEKEFGWVRGVAKKTPYGDQPPAELDITVKIENGEKITETCFYGNIQIAAWEDATLKINFAGPNVLVITNTRKRYKDQIREFYSKVDKYLQTNSIYRGTAVVVDFDETPTGEVVPNFDIFENKVSDHIFLNDAEEMLVTELVMEELGDEGKRTYLFSGGYGNAKTETAMRVGQHATNKNLTFFYCKSAGAYKDLLSLAVAYAPCLIFMEDVDEIGSGNGRGASMNALLNTLDGVETKNKSLTTVFTTNHENRINPALRRPGRIDAIIPFNDPETATVSKIYKHFFSGLPGGKNLDYDKLAEKTPKAPGAVVAEIAKRSVSFTKKRGGKITEQLVDLAIVSFKPHLELMRKEVEENTNGKVLEALELIGEGFNGYLSDNDPDDE